MTHRLLANWAFPLRVEPPRGALRASRVGAWKHEGRREAFQAYGALQLAPEALEVLLDRVTKRRVGVIIIHHVSVDPQLAAANGEWP